jgi:hypothetical protein
MTQFSRIEYSIHGRMYTRCSVYSIFVPFLFGYLTRPVFLPVGEFCYTNGEIIPDLFSVIPFGFWLLLGYYNGRRASSQLMNAQHQTLVSTLKSQSYMDS